MSLSSLVPVRLSSVLIRWSRVPVASNERIACSSTEMNQIKVGSVMGGQPRSALEPTVRLHPVGGSQNQTVEGFRISDCSVLAGPAMLQQIASHVGQHHHSRQTGDGPGERFARQSTVAHRSRADQVRREWSAGIHLAVLGAPGLKSNTGGTEEEASLLCDCGGSSPCDQHEPAKSPSDCVSVMRICAHRYQRTKPMSSTRLGTSPLRGPSLESR